MTSAVVSAHLDALATSYPTLCTRSGPGDWKAGWAGGQSGYLKIGVTTAASPSQRWAVLITGGVHARELAPPNALVTFLEKLLAAYASSSAITYPSWTDPVAGIVYDSFTIPWPWVRKAVESLDLYVAPLVNDDGHDYVLATLPNPVQYDEQSQNKLWRKNRRAAPAGVTDPNGVGVDINRNFDIVWNYPDFYNTAIAGVHSSDQPVSYLYIGPSAESEPETQNVANLMRSKNISYFLDVHAFSRDVLYSWGTETDQSTDQSMTFTNQATWKSKRDGTQHSAYEEYIPVITAKSVQAAAQHISDQILAKAGGSSPDAQARSAYTVKQSAALYVTSGASDDYCFSRWFAPATGGAAISPVQAFTLEVGGDPADGPDHDEGRFTPDYVKHYPKLEREIHVAAWTFLSMAANTNFVQPQAPPAPSGSGSSCGSSVASVLIMLAAAITALVMLR